MNIVENYALMSGQKIDEISIYEKPFPLPFERYITFQPFSKEIKNYDWWFEVVLILKPIFDKFNIQIVQLGSKDQPAIPFCYILIGNTTVNQAAYLIKHSMLHFGTDSFGAHLAGRYNKPLVCLYSNNYINCVKPYFGDSSKQILLEPDRNGEKPIFAFQESPKSINRIRPEKIAKAICDLLKLPLNYQYKSLLFGQAFTARLLDFVPNQLVDPKQFGVESLIFRMDYYFDENILARQIQFCRGTIITNKPINKDLLLSIKPKINDVVYFIDENHDPSFIKFLARNGFKFQMVCYKSQDFMESIKLDYMDFGVIVHKPEPSIPDDLKDIPIKDLFYRSNKITLCNNKIYGSQAAWKDNVPLNNMLDTTPIINNSIFWREAEHFYILKKVDNK